MTLTSKDVGVFLFYFRITIQSGKSRGRNLLKEGFNPLADLDKEYDSFIEAENDWMEECEEHDFMESNPSKDEILVHNPEYEKYFA